MRCRDKAICITGLSKAYCHANDLKFTGFLQKLKIDSSQKTPYWHGPRQGTFVKYEVALKYVRQWGFGEYLDRLLLELESAVDEQPLLKYTFREETLQGERFARIRSNNLIVWLCVSDHTVNSSHLISAAGLHSDSTSRRLNAAGIKKKKSRQSVGPHSLGGSYIDFDDALKFCKILGSTKWHSILQGIGREIFGTSVLQVEDYTPLDTASKDDSSSDGKDMWKQHSYVRPEIGASKASSQSGEEASTSRPSASDNTTGQLHDFVSQQGLQGDFVTISSTNEVCTDIQFRKVFHRRIHCV